MFVFVSLLAMIASTLWVAFRYYQWFVSPLHKIPGPKPFGFWLGSTRYIFFTSFMSSHKRWWKELRKKHDDVPLMAYSTVLGQWSVHVLDCDLVQYILQQPSKQLRFPKQYSIIRIMTGNGLVALEGEAWSRHRRIIQPAFLTRNLRQVLANCAPVLVGRLVRAWKSKPPGEPIDVFSHLASLMLDVFGTMAVGVDFGGMRAIEQSCNSVHPIPLSVHSTFVLTPSLVVFGLLGLEKLYGRLSPTLDSTNKLLDRAVDQSIRDASLNTEASSQTTSLMQLLLQAKDVEGSARKGLSHSELKAETRTFIVVGHETTSVWCYWALYALSTNLDIQEKLFEDIRHHAPKTSSIGLEQVDEMVYLHAFLKEVLRMYPPVGFVLRHTSQDEVWKGYTVPAHTRLVIPIHLLHRHPDHWDSPDAFRPERWLEKDSRHKFCFLPFLGGDRNCIGQRMAEIEAKIIIANIVSAFKVTKDGDYVKLIHFMTMKSDPLVKMSFEFRER